MRRELILLPFLLEEVKEAVWDCDRFESLVLTCDFLNIFGIC